MTLILTLTSPAYTLQVSDRLLTQGDRQFDQFANKALIVRARDALVSIGYSGLAYVRGDPTDLWLAEQVSGVRMEARGIRMGQLPRWPDIGTIVGGLVQELNRLPLNWRRSMGEIVIAGWQWSRRKPARPRQILWLLRSANRDAPYLANQLVARHLPARQQVRLLYVPRGTPVTDARMETLVNEIRNYGPQGHDDAERILVDEVRRVATETLRVGPHCVSILISRFIGRPQVRVRYRPHGEHLLVIRDGPPVPVAFTPWLIGPDGIAPPSLAVGGAFGTCGRLDVSIEVPDVPESSQLKAIYRSQDRPAAPGRLPGLYSRPDE